MEIKELILNSIAHLEHKEAAKLYNTSAGVVAQWRTGRQSPNEKHCQIYLQKYADNLNPIEPVGEPVENWDEQPATELPEPVKAAEPEGLVMRRRNVEAPLFTGDARTPQQLNTSAAAVAPAQPQQRVPKPAPMQSAFPTIKQNGELPPAPVESVPVVKQAPQVSVPTPVSQKTCSILFPCYRQTNPLTMWALMQLFDKDKHNFHMQWRTHLIKARNILADEFLNQTQNPWSFWLDDDMVPVCGKASWWKKNVSAPKDFPDQYAGLHTLKRLASHGKKIISSLYYGREPDGRAMFAEAIMQDSDNVNAHRNVPRNILRPTQGMAAGCMLVHREVFLDIMRTHPEEEPKNGMPWPFFNQIGTAPEDMSFSIRARKAGHELFVDMGCMAAHIGSGIYGSWNTKFEVPKEEL